VLVLEKYRHKQAQHAAANVGSFTLSSLQVNRQTQTSVLLGTGSADGPAIVAADEEHGCAQSAGKVDSSMEVSL